MDVEAGTLATVDARVETVDLKPLRYAVTYVRSTPYL